MRQKNNQTIADSIVFSVPPQERESQRHHTTGLYHHQYINPILREESQNHDCFVVLGGRGRNLLSVEAWPNLPAHR